MKVALIPAFEDNYFFLMEDQGRAMIVDPGRTPEVLEYLRRQSIKLGRILVTHHHADHIGGVLDLQRETGAEVYGPSSLAKYGIHCDRVLSDGDNFSFQSFKFKVIAVPGHTLDHLAYYEERHHALFCGDTLFSLGCGRLFEGSFEQMFASLAKFKSLPEHTAVYCAHEYTLNNLRFSRQYLAETGANANLRKKYEELFRRVTEVRAKDVPTIPSTLGFEQEFNLFFNAPSLAAFKAVRTARNHF